MRHQAFVFLLGLALLCAAPLAASSDWLDGGARIAPHRSEAPVRFIETPTESHFKNHYRTYRVRNSGRICQWRHGVDQAPARFELIAFLSELPRGCQYCLRRHECYVLGRDRYSRPELYLAAGASAPYAHESRPPRTHDTWRPPLNRWDRRAAPDRNGNCRGSTILGGLLGAFAGDRDRRGRNAVIGGVGGNLLCRMSRPQPRP